ncbi:MAG: hypothetical protein A3H98_06970 [Bacteroidetes bacterium RIFCSPLOWO2_02_FULL_36_8]|nr:MAG: hypothetical protein A3H98_06970 [Bacteroidetes bacterium RIFCSPLOWO2_02_FULL_36_8]OFY70434.1 MAG: hypothetical protein A3G23_09920 [Bacteroidetes bacterium RIFCSPLOWO2_12_FULL_37_12]
MLPLSQIPPVTKIIIILNFIFFILGRYLVPYEISELLPLYYFQSHCFRPFQILSSMFMHANFVHIALNMFAFYSLGSFLESVVGTNRFAALYLVSGFGSALMVMLVGYFQINYFNFCMAPCGISFQPTDCTQYVHPVVGASGAIMGVFAALALFMPDAPLQIIFLPIKFRASTVLWGFFVVSVLGIFGLFRIGLSHEGHLGGMIAGMILFKTRWYDNLR